MQLVEKALAIFVGSLLIGAGINAFLVPHKLLEGGAVGISLIFHYLIDAKVGLTFLIISIPIFIVAWFYYRSFFYNGIHGMLVSSILIDVLYPLHLIGNHLTISPVASAALGGIFIGTGVGIMFRRDVSMGGIDLLGQMLSRKLHQNPGIIIFCFDIVIVTVGCFLIPSSHLLLSYTTVFFVALSTSILVSGKSPNETSRQFPTTRDYAD